MRLKNKSADGSIRYLAFDTDSHKYTTDYFADNGGWLPCVDAKKGQLKELVNAFDEDGRWSKVDRLPRC